MSTPEEEFRRRLRLIMQQFGSVADLAKAVGVSDNAIYKWVSGRGQPSMTSLVNLANAAGVSVEWLATGATAKAKPDFIDTNDAATFVKTPPGTVKVPGSPITIRSVQAVDYLRFDLAWLLRRFDVDPNQLSLIETVGDAMAPTLDDRDLCLVDLRESRFRHDGLYALWDNVELSIKRLQREADGLLAVRSDNPVYAPVRVSGDALIVLGRVIWICGKP
jgi:phage repressor protein C with HTH and peptisase S24 domain